MRKDSKVSDVLHVLLHMADHEGPLTSQFLASMMQTNPVVVRRTLGGLRERGLVESTKGRAGGWKLARDLSQVTLLDVYQAVGEPTIFAMGPRHEASNCLVEKAVNAALSDTFESAQKLLMDRFAAITLQQLHDGFSKDMAAIRKSLLAEEDAQTN